MSTLGIGVSPIRASLQMKRARRHARQRIRRLGLPDVETQLKDCARTSSLERMESRILQQVNQNIRHRVCRQCVETVSRVCRACVDSVSRACRQCVGGLPRVCRESRECKHESALWALRMLTKPRTARRGRKPRSSSTKTFSGRFERRRSLF